MGGREKKGEGEGGEHESVLGVRRNEGEEGGIGVGRWREERKGDWGKRTRLVQHRQEGHGRGDLFHHVPDLGLNCLLRLGFGRGRRSDFHNHSKGNNTGTN